MATRKNSPSDAGDDTGAASDPLNPLNAIGQSMQGAAERIQSLNLTGTAASMMESGRKDIEALMAANRRSFEDLQAVVQRQTQGLRQSINEWQSAVAKMPGQDISANLGKLDEMGRAAFQQALDDIRELAEVAAKSQTEAFNIVRQRISENVDQAAQLLQPGAKKK